VAALVVDPPGARGRSGLDPVGAPAPAPRPFLARAVGAALGAAEPFDTISFRGHDCAARPDGRYDVRGTLAIHGVRQAIDLPLAVSDHDGLHATGTWSGRSGLGPAPVSGADDRLQVFIDVRGPAVGGR